MFSFKNYLRLFIPTGLKSLAFVWYEFRNYTACNFGVRDGKLIILGFEINMLPEKKVSSRKCMLLIVNITEVEFYVFNFHFFCVFSFQVL